MTDLNLDDVVDSIFKSEEEMNKRKEFDKRETRRLKYAKEWHKENYERSINYQAKILKAARRARESEEAFARSEEGYGLP